MKRLSVLIIVFFCLCGTDCVQAQVLEMSRHLDKAEAYIRDGDCEKAQKEYNAFLKLKHQIVPYYKKRAEQVSWSINNCFEEKKKKEDQQASTSPKSSNSSANSQPPATSTTVQNNNSSGSGKKPTSNTSSTQNQNAQSNKPKEAPKTIPTISTDDVYSIEFISAKCGGYVSKSGGTPITACGICWSKNPHPTTSDYCTTDGSEIGQFSSDLNNLSPGTDYYVRAYAINGVGTAYGQEVKFRTMEQTKPAVVSTGVKSVETNGAIFEGNIIADGGSPITASGVCWSENPNPTIYDFHISDGSGTGSFINKMDSLSSGTSYYVRAFATNSVGTAYGDVISFETKGPKVKFNNLEIRKIGKGNIDFSLNIDVYSDHTEWGVCLSRNPSPTINDYHKMCGTYRGRIGSSSYISADLKPGIIYYMRGYASNSSGTVYGEEISFRMPGGYPVFDSLYIVSVEENKAECKYTLSYRGDRSIGICFSKNPEPTYKNNHAENGILYGLEPNTDYYVRIYSGGESSSSSVIYSDIKKFRTLPAKIKPCASSVTDYDGNVYKTVQLGSQCWMAENLKTKHYADGTPIKDRKKQGSTSFWWFPGGKKGNMKNYGLLYNWAAVFGPDQYSIRNQNELQGICPDGWHIPNQEDWLYFTNFIRNQDNYLCDSNSNYIAKALASTTGWYTSWDRYTIGKNPSNNNATGFSAVAAGSASGSYFSGFGKYSYYWLDSQNGKQVSYWYLTTNSKDITYKYINYSGGMGYSVRCLKD